MRLLRLPAVLVAALLATTAAPAAAQEPVARDLQLVAPDATVTMSGRFELPYEVQLTARGEALELEAARLPDGAMALRERRGGVVVPSAARADGFRGVAGLLHVRLLDGQGRVLVDERRTVCPNTGVALPAQGTELDDDGEDGGAARSAYPFSCGYPLSRAVVWGLARDAAVPLALTAWSMRPGRRLAPGRYRLELVLDPDALLPDADRANNRVSVPVHVRAERRTPHPRRERPGREDRARAGPVALARAGAAEAGAAQLPDLVPLPPAAVSVEGGRLAFDAVVANVGEGSLLVRGAGARSHRARRQAAYQLLADGRRVVARRRTRDLVRDDRDGHGHWHVDGLARYRLRDAAGRVVARSGKVGFCFLNTTPVDLRFERPAWTLVPPDDGNFCEGRRPFERLDPGWGDLYVQSVAGQALDIRRVPNGAYRIEVAVNADGSLLESDRTNDVVARTVVLGGRPGRRTVQLPPFGGVDTMAEMGPLL